MANPPFKVKAVYEYSSPHEDDLNFPFGQIITVVAEEDADWYVGEYDDASGAKKEGLFPKNFVEKYEPPVPTRPSRPARPKAEQPPTPIAPIEQPIEESRTTVEEPEPLKAQVSQASEPPLLATATKPQVEPPVEPPAAPKPAPAAKAPPPAVSEKPSSFKDRIAAFNKGSAPPIAPKPAGAPSASSFIKKPYVAPPPSKNAYVPPPREPTPQKVYRREEDPEVAERHAQDVEAAEAAGLAGPEAATQATEEDAPKPQSLKERIALLQKQQAEQAMRRAEASQKEKPKKPHKKPAEPRDGQEAATIEQESAPASEEISRASTDLAGEASRRSTDRRASRGPKSPDSAHHQRELFSDGNDADQSAAGETTEDAEGTSGLEDIDDRIQPSIPTAHARAPAAPKEEANVGDEEDTTEEEEEESEMDAETRRKLELRERIAKMSGGMGMAGMFGPSMPTPGAPPKKKKSGTSNQDQREAENTSPTSRQPQPAPMVPVPGMQRTLSPKQELEVAPLDVSRGEGVPHPITSQQGPEEVPDVEDIKVETPARRSTDRRSTDRAPPPPIPQGKCLHPPCLDVVQRSIAGAHNRSDSIRTPAWSNLDGDGCYDRVFIVRVRRMSGGLRRLPSLLHMSIETNISQSDLCHHYQPSVRCLRDLEPKVRNYFNPSKL